MGNKLMKNTTRSDDRTGMTSGRIKITYWLEHLRSTVIEFGLLEEDEILKTLAFPRLDTAQSGRYAYSD